METPTLKGITVTALTLLVVAGMFPVGNVAAHIGDGCHQDDEFPGKITLSNPLAGQISASELVYFMAAEDEDALQRTNGIDAYVVDLGCENTNLRFDLARDDGNGGDYEFNVRFFDASLDDVGEVNGDVNEDLEGEFVPTDARYAVIELEQGPLVTGFHASHGVGFYSISFMMETYL